MTERAEQQGDLAPMMNRVDCSMLQKIASSHEIGGPAKGKFPELIEIFVLKARQK
jgi:hypothetical protein